ncbi:glycosyltransferase family 9 protein [Sebaldella sp. S0638]|uniref:glycosyltransferase family 9 protein n=1 Tax=Sebaldella sp. S0638 TaxID=2957809 RepID=UPI0020A104AE|nr:glycosyltransferase family 9 protein [Sebaldella sp. S0638]MCP1223105.1 glycosyltransferase family 9 protein [Sebaldella sp. S0638]
MNILVIHTAFIGDIALSTPFVRALSDTYPDANLYYLTTPAGAALLQNNPLIKEVVVFDKKGKDKGLKGFFKTVKLLRKYKLNKVFILHRYLRSSFLGYFSGAKERIGFDIASGSFLYTKKVKYRKDLHEIDRLLEFVDGEHGKYKVEIYPSDVNVGNIDKIWQKYGIKEQKIIAVAPGSKWYTKMWPREYFDDLLERLSRLDNVKTVLVGGKEDKEIELKNENMAVDLRGETSLLDLAEILKRTDVLVTNDSSPIHIGSAFEKPFIAAIFGPTVKEFGFTPSNKKNTVIEIEGLECRPCGMHGHDKCPLGHFKCMKEILPEKVFDIVVNNLKS